MNAVLKSIFHNGISSSEEIVPKDPEYRAVNRKIGVLRLWFQAGRFARGGGLYTRRIAAEADRMKPVGKRLGFVPHRKA